MPGGKVAIMKGKNRFGKRVNGSVGKSFAYGAQRGRLFVQGDADYASASACRGPTW